MHESPSFVLTTNRTLNTCLMFAEYQKLTNLFISLYDFSLDNPQITSVFTLSKNSRFKFRNVHC